MTDKERILTLISTMTAYATTEHRLLSENSVRWEYIHQDTILKNGDKITNMVLHFSRKK